MLKHIVYGEYELDLLVDFEPVIEDIGIGSYEFWGSVEHDSNEIVVINKINSVKYNNKLMNFSRNEIDIEIILENCTTPDEVKGYYAS